jgi:hypothetical protein
MTTHSGLYPRRTAAWFFALFLGLGATPALQTAQAAVSETEAGNSLLAAEAALPPETQTETAAPMILADNYNNKNWNKNWSKNNNWNNNNNWNKNNNWNNNNKNWNNNWSKNQKYYNKNHKYKYGNKNYRYNNRVYVQRWYPRPYYGQFFGGIVLGSILTAGAIGVAPPPPAPELCWYWIDPYRSRGYWDYCPPY